MKPVLFLQCRKMPKIIRLSTVPGSLNAFCKGLFRELQETEGYQIIAVTSPGDSLHEIREREGVKTIAVPIRRHISPLNDLVSLWRLMKVFRKERPDMIHSITPKAGLLSMIAGKICGVPVRLHTFTGLVFPTASGFKRKILMLTDRITCACATHIVPEGQGVKNDLRKFKITKKTLEVLGYGNIRGIDLQFYNPDLPDIRKEADKIRGNLLDSSGEKVFIFIFIGRLVRDKGINELVKTFSKLRMEAPQARLLLVGAEERGLDPLLPETIAEMETNPGIFMAGPQKDVRPWLLASDALVFPSYREGFPNVVIEAGAMNLPSIVTDINGSREIIIEGRNGLIIPPLVPNGSSSPEREDAKSDALFSAMHKFVSDSSLVSSMALNSRGLIASRFEQSFVRSCLKQYYRSLLNSEADNTEIFK